MTDRTSEFKRNDALEGLLRELTGLLSPAGEALAETYRGRDFGQPLLLVVGPMRSGSTLLMQWLASLGEFSYPSNLLSRFYYAPVLGAKIQELLAGERYRYRDEMDGLAPARDFSSSNGKTKGVLSPNEFGYFWERHVHFGESCRVDEEKIKRVDMAGLRAELCGIMDVFGKPFAVKAMKLNYNINFLRSISERVLLLRMSRDPLNTVESVLKARSKQYGTIEEWYSLKVPEYSHLKELSPLEQVCGQVASINSVLDKSLTSIDNKNKLEIPYEAFCNDPARYYTKIRKKLEGLGHLSAGAYKGPGKFTATNVKVAEETADTYQKVKNEIMKNFTPRA